MLEAIDYCIIGEWLLENLNWITPLIITIIFSTVNIQMVRENLKLIKAQNKLQNEVAEAQMELQKEMAEAQIKLQNDSFCYQLLDRRMEIYTNMRVILSETLSAGQITSDQLTQYLHQTREVSLLFGAEVEETVERIYRLLSEFHAVSKMVNRNLRLQQATPDHAELCERESELLGILSDENAGLIEVFKKYISFKNYKIEQ